MTDSLTDLQKRILLAAVRLEGKLILWILEGGRIVIPGIQQDAAEGMRALEGAGLLVQDEVERKHERGAGPSRVGWHVFRLTEAGERAANRAIGRIAAGEK